MSDLYNWKMAEMNIYYQLHSPSYCRGTFSLMAHSNVAINKQVWILFTFECNASLIIRLSAANLTWISKFHTYTTFNGQIPNTRKHFMLSRDCSAITTVNFLSIKLLI